MSLDQKWQRSAGAPDSSTDPGTEPFADNTNQSITPRTLRNFSYEVNQILDIYETRIAALEAQLAAP